MHFAFHLRCEVAEIEYNVSIWRDVALRVGPKWFGSTSYRVCTADEIRVFLARLRELNVPYWKREYADYSAFDGWNWRVGAVIDGRTLSSEGCNDYPPRFLALCEHVFYFTQLDGLIEAAKKATR
jgi:hypothetical protein